MPQLLERRGSTGNDWPISDLPVIAVVFIRPANRVQNTYTVPIWHTPEVDIEMPVQMDSPAPAVRFTL